jgi:peptidoglycan/LPS O-acetylase OafA/YrhL
MLDTTTTRSSTTSQPGLTNRSVSNSRSPGNPNFDLLRLFFALSVVWFHCWNATGRHINGSLPAVPGFLAISGYLVLQSYEQSGSWQVFAWRRFLRVFPAFACVLAGGWLLFGARTPVYWLKCWVSLGLWPGNHDAVVWSLGWEEVFYALLAVLFSLGAYRKPLLIWCLLLASVFIEVNLVTHTTAPLRRALPLAASFWMGNLAYLYRDRLARIPAPISVVTMAVLLCTIHSFMGPLYHFHQLALIASFLLFAVSGPRVPINFKVDVSYGTYLYHTLIIRLFLSHHIHQRFELMVLTYTVSLGLATISWLLVEKPALALKGALRVVRSESGRTQLVWSPASSKS